MKKAFSILALLMATCLYAAPALAGNPFTAKPEKRQETPDLSINHQAFAEIVAWQRQLKEKMSVIIREMQSGRSLKPLVFLMTLAFVYGMVHAAGPGHGKLLALSYFVSCGGKYGRAVLFGNMIAVFHGLSGVVFVIAARILINRTVSETLPPAGALTQKISFGLIVALGALLMTRAAIRWRNDLNAETEAPGDAPIPVIAKPAVAALVIGMVPCPAVVLVMLFCLSIGWAWLGVGLSVMIALGMAVTITAVVLFGLAGKKMIARFTGKRKRLSRNIEGIIETLAAAAITFLGIVFFLSA